MRDTSHCHDQRCLDGERQLLGPFWWKRIGVGLLWVTGLTLIGVTFKSFYDRPDEFLTIRVGLGWLQLEIHLVTRRDPL